MLLKRLMYEMSEETHTSICEEKQENPTQSSSYQVKENRNSNSSQSPTNTIAKNTTHMGATHSLHPTNRILKWSQ